MVISSITHKTYDQDEGVYIANMLQARLYLLHLGPDYLLDILYDSQKKPNSLVFVFKRCPETRELKIKWDNHLLTDKFN